MQGYRKLLFHDESEIIQLNQERRTKINTTSTGTGSTNKKYFSNSTQPANKSTCQKINNDMNAQIETNQ